MRFGGSIRLAHLILGLAVSYPTSAEVLELMVVCDSATARRSGEIRNRSRHELKLLTNGTDWRLTSLWSSGRGQDWGYTNGEAYGLRRATVVNRDGEPLEGIRHRGEIVAGSYPYPAPPEIKLTWFAYCSGPLLADAGSFAPIVAPWGPVWRRNVSQYDCRVVDWLAAAKYPETVHFFPFQIGEGGNNGRRKTGGSETQASIGENLESVYQVTGVTNVAERLTVPLEFWLTQFRSQPPPGQDMRLARTLRGKLPSYVRSVTRGRLESIRVVPDEETVEWIPVPIPEMLIQDLRFLTEEFPSLELFYRMPPGTNWPAMFHPTVKRLATQRQQNFVRREQEQQARREWQVDVAIIGGLILVCGLAAYARFGAKLWDFLMMRGDD